MKKILLSTLGLIAMGVAAPASAADMTVKAPPPAPLPVIYNWSGFYIGGNGGWGSSHTCWDFVTLAGPVFSDGCRDRDGGLLGRQIGYRWQSNQLYSDWKHKAIGPTSATRASACSTRRSQLA